MNISNNWFAFALLISAFGVGYALGHYNTDEIIVLGYSESHKNMVYIRKKEGKVYTCYGDWCVRNETRSDDDERRVPL